MHLQIAQGIVFVLDCISQIIACQATTVNHKPAHDTFYNRESQRKINKNGKGILP